MRRLLTLLTVLALAAAACGGDAATSTTAAAPTSTTAMSEETTTSTDGGAAITTTTGTTTTTLALPEAPFILKGETGPHVFALQSYLDCAGYGPIDVDGVFGDGTAASVMQAQAAEGKEQTGEPDEQTFAELSRACDRPRDIVFPEDSISTEVAGNAAPGDDEVFNLRVLEGQEMTITIWTQGAVDLAIQGTDGTVLHRPDGSPEIVVTISTSQMYALRVSAEMPTSYRLAITIPAVEEETTTTTEAPADNELYYTSDGLNLVDFGAGSGRTITALTDLLGPPVDDTDWFTPDEGDDCATLARVITWVLPGTEGMMSTTIEVEIHDALATDDDPAFRRWRAYLTFGYDDVAPESGWFSTVDGLSPGDSYLEAVGYGFQLGGYEELSAGSLHGIRVDIFTGGGTYEEDGQVGSMEAGDHYCVFEEP